MEKYAIGIDPSTKNVGIALLKNKKVLQALNIKLKRMPRHKFNEKVVYDFYEITKSIQAFLELINKDSKVNKVQVLIEYNFFGNLNHNGREKQMFYNGLINAILLNNCDKEIKLDFCFATHWQSLMNKNPEDFLENDLSPKQKSCINASAVAGYKIINDNIADAINIAYYCGDWESESNNVN